MKDETINQVILARDAMRKVFPFSAGCQRLDNALAVSFLTRNRKDFNAQAFLQHVNQIPLPINEYLIHVLNQVRTEAMGELTIIYNIHQVTSTKDELFADVLESIITSATSFLLLVADFVAVSERVN